MDFRLTTMKEHGNNMTAPVVMCCYSMWQVCSSCFSYANNTWTRVLCKWFCVDVTLLGVIRVCWLISIYWECLNGCIMHFLLYRCDVVWYDKGVLDHFHLSAIHEQWYFVLSSMSLWCCLMSFNVLIHSHYSTISKLVDFETTAELISCCSMWQVRIN